MDAKGCKEYPEVSFAEALAICGAAYVPWPKPPTNYTEESVMDYEQAYDRIKAANDELFARKGSVLKRCYALVKAAYGSARLAGSRKEHIWGPPYPYNPYQRDTARRTFERLAKEQEAKQREAEMQAQQDAITGRAVVYLIERGYKPGDDFPLSAAAGFALELAAQEEIKTRLAKAKESGAYLPFNGMNCDDCEGWDGESRRCQCGNRRVSWEWGGTFESPYVYGEAY